jgi:hypothetical protein
MPLKVLYLILTTLCNTAGHYHPGGYAKVGNTHFVTVESILEAPTNSHAHGIIHVFEKEIIIEGSGEVTPRKLQLD